MLNSYVNSGKKKLVATTLALAITFSSVSSVSYKLCDYLCLNASATEVEQTQANDAEGEANIARLHAIFDEKSTLVEFQDYLTEIVLPILNQLDPEARELKEELKDDKDKLKKRVKAAYDLEESEKHDLEKKYGLSKYLLEECKKHRNNLIERAIIDFFQYGLMRTAVNTCYCQTKCIVHDDLTNEIREKITDCETFEEADNLIETIVNDEAYKKIDNLVLQYYVDKGFIYVNRHKVELGVLFFWDDEDLMTGLSALNFSDFTFTESSVNNILDQIAARLDELEKEEVEIRQNTYLRPKLRALKEEYRALEQRRRVLEQRREELDLEYSVLRDDMSTVDDKMRAIKTELAKLDKN